MAFPTSIWLMLVWLLITKLSWSLVPSCPEKERQALLSFKHGVVKDPSNRLSSWVAVAGHGHDDCCKWKGVGCDTETGHVVKLDLRNPVPYSYNDDGPNYDDIGRASLIVHKVNPSLLELKHLNYLDLSWNNFSGSEIPEFFGSFQEPTYLNLSCAVFGGFVPHSLGNLSALRSLDLSTKLQTFDEFTFPSELGIDAFHWASKLFELQYLDLSGLYPIDFSRTLTSFPSLLELRLSQCGLGAIPLFDFPQQNFTSLVILDLSSNSFSGPIPNAIRNMSSLELLDLSGNMLNGSLPKWLYLLKNLKTLNLHDNSFTGASSGAFSSLIETVNLQNNRFNGPLPDWLYQLKNLKTLHLSGNELNGSISASLGNLSKLEALYLGGNNLSGPIPMSLGNLSKLEVLDLSGNELSDNISASLGNLSKLETLDLSGNKLSGPIPTSLGNLSKLETLVLRYNKLSGPIPASLGTLSKLKKLWLDSNQLSGPIPASLGTLSKLKELWLYSNQLSGPIPLAIGNLSLLATLDLSYNRLNGEIPTSIGQLSNLIGIYLTECELSGYVPESLGQLSKLTILDMGGNSFNGVLTELHFANLSELNLLDLGNNSLSLHPRSGWIPPFHLDSIYVAHCDLGPQFPDWLQTQTNMVEIIMSNNQITSIPSWFANITSKLNSLDFSNNQIHGKLSDILSPRNIYSGVYELNISNNSLRGQMPTNIGDMLPILSILLLSNNHFEGSIPNSLCELTSIVTLDLSRNHLSGSLPQNWYIYVESIDLRFNNLSGTIPSSMGHLPKLSSLLLSRNKFHGNVPATFQNCSHLSVLDVGENALFGEIPPWIGESLLFLKVLRLRSNKYTGNIPPKLCRLNKLRILDLANNHLSGTIPSCFMNFSAMAFNQTDAHLAKSNNFFEYNPEQITEVVKGRELEYINTLGFLLNIDLSCNNFIGHIPQELTSLSLLVGLNLSNNHLTGTIPNNIGRMRSLESLDLSKNHLSGRIPPSISSLSSLSYLSVSYNNLSGAIPTGNQLQTLENSSNYEGNHELCGHPLTKQCTQNESLLHVNFKREEVERDEFKLWFYIGMTLGFVLGFWSVCGVLIFKRSWRYAFIRFVDDMEDTLFVAIMVKMVRLKTKFKSREAEE